MSDKRGIYRVGNQGIGRADRIVLAVWSGQKIPQTGEVHLHLTAEERISLEVLKQVLGIRG